MNKKQKIMFRITLLVLVTVIAGLALFFGLRYHYDEKAPGFSDEFVLLVRPDMTAAAVQDSLSAHALRAGSIRRCARSENLEGRVRPGRYVVKPSHPAVYAVRMVIMGWQTPTNLTLSGTIRTKARLAQTISRQMMVDSVSVADALEDEAFLAGYGFTPENVFALFLPDTYQMYWTASVKDLFDRFKKERDLFWNDERKAAAREQGLTPMEATVLASIINGETLNRGEYRRIAGVYLNRYRIGMKLQADPTVCFCFDYKLDRVLRKHLSVDSPYNTYRYRGLPPAPINVPPKACIDAALHPEKHDYIYFCASSAFDGTHDFAVTYSQHLANARVFQRALTARRKAAAEATASN